MHTDLLAAGSFTIGCNYWASHAGTRMWSDWREEVVDADFALLARHQLRLVRIFALWPDFQPLVSLRGNNGHLVEYRLAQQDHETPFEARPHASVDPVMLQRLRRLCQLASRHGLQLVVGLVTGWMSGRLFMPRALEGRNPITDPVALAWQSRLVKGIVHACREEDAIYGWDLGNECNCMGAAANADEAYHWTATIADAIRATDPSRPIISGMHSLTAQSGGVWRIIDQGELTDVVTTHPYPYWLQHGRVDALDAYRTTLLPTVETCLYRDIAGKPCFAEEIGSMGPMVSCDQVAARWIRANLFSLWAHDTRAMLWWCAFDQTVLGHAPYDWYGVEAELGLIDQERRPKSALREMGEFSTWLQGCPVSQLPPRRTDAVCVLSRNQDAWATAIGAFALAKQAGFEITFRFVDQEVPPAPLILLPGLTGPNAIRRHEWHRLLARVRAGASLYVSLHDGVVPQFTETTGVGIVRRSNRSTVTPLFFAGETTPAWQITAGDELECISKSAQVLAAGPQQEALFTVHAFGAGRVFVLTFPLEAQVALGPGALEPERCAGARRIYAQLAQALPEEPALRCEDPRVGVTQHDLPDGSVVVVLINYTRQAVETPVKLAPGLGWHRILRGAGAPTGRIKVPAQDAVVVQLIRGTSPCS